MIINLIKFARYCTTVTLEDNAIVKETLLHIYVDVGYDGFWEDKLIFFSICLSLR